MSKQKISIAMILFLLSGYLVVLTAQETTPTPSAEEQRREERIRRKEQRNEEAALDKEYRETLLSPSATPLEGKTELSDVTLEPQLMSYRAMSTACNCIATRVHNRDKQAEVIVIYDPEAVSGLKYYRFSYPIVDARLKGISDRFDKAIAGGGAAAPASLFSPAIVTDVLRSFADVLAMFRTDTKIEGKSVSIAQKALVAELQFALYEKYGKNVILYDPGSFSPDDGATLVNGKLRSNVLQSLIDGYMKRDKVLYLIDTTNMSIDTIKKKIKAIEDEIADLEDKIAKLKAEIPKLKSDAKKAKTKKKREELEQKAKQKEADLATAETRLPTAKVELEAEKTNLAPAEIKLNKLSNIVKEFDALVAELMTINEKTGTNDLLVFLKAESLEMVLKDSNDKTKDRKYYWLDIASVSAGGNNRTRRNLLLYITGSKVDHSGGVIVDWRLLNPQWQFAEGGKTQVYEGYLSSKKIRDNQTSYSDADLTTKCGYPVKGQTQQTQIAKIDP